ncbi:MAG: hypothetical protein WKF52_00560 [Sphingomicrobium sp.]
MGHDSKAVKFGAAFAAFAMLLSSTAHATPSGFGTVDPLVSLSVFGTSSSRAAVCAAGASAAATAGSAAAVQAPPGAGCVLPILDAVPPPIVQSPVVGIAPVGGGGIGIVPIVLGAAALAALVYLILNNDDNDDDDDDDIDPISPS